MYSRTECRPVPMEDFGLSDSLNVHANEGVLAYPSPKFSPSPNLKSSIMELEMSAPSLEDAEEIETFCQQVFPASYDHSWYGHMLVCDTVHKVCYRHEGRIIALIVGQVARREAWNGVLQLSMDGADIDQRQKVTAYIMLLGVEKSFRRFGLGSKLLMGFVRTVSAAWPDVPRSFFLHVATENTAAMEMYQRHGFRRTQLLPNYYDYGKKRDELSDLHDAYLYVKEIESTSAEMFDNLWDCLTCTSTTALTLVQRMISVILVPANFIFQCTKDFFSFHTNTQKFNLKMQPAKLV